METRYSVGFSDDPIVAVVDSSDEFTTLGPNGPYIDTAITPRFIRQSQLEQMHLTGEQRPVIDSDEWRVRVAGGIAHVYPEMEVIGDMLRYEFTPSDAYVRPMMDFERDVHREPDELELMYPHAAEPLKIPHHYLPWVWDAIEQVFPKYAAQYRPKPLVQRHVNVGTIGHLDYDRPCYDRKRLHKFQGRDWYGAVKEAGVKVYADDPAKSEVVNIFAALAERVTTEQRDRIVTKLVGKENWYINRTQPNN